MRNTVERMAILTPGDLIPVESVPSELRLYQPVSSVQEARAGAERELLQRALDEADWNVSAAARRLGMERTTLHKRIRALGLRRG